MPRQGALPAPKGTLQLPLGFIVPESDWKPPRLEDLPDLSQAKRLSWDTETRDPGLSKQVKMGPGCMGRKDSYLVGWSLAVEDGPKLYMPIRHDGGDNMECGPEKALAWLRDLAKRFTGQLVGMNLGYDMGWGMAEGVEWNRDCKVRDVQVAEACINELYDDYSLEAICERHDIPGKDESLLRKAASAYGVDPKGGLWRLPARFVGEYGEGDADRPLRVLRRQEKIIDKDDLWQVFDLESDVLPVLVRMRHRGIRVNEDKLKGFEDWALREEVARWREASRMCDTKLGMDDAWSSGTLAKALAKVGIQCSLTEDGNESVDKNLLASANHPAATAILEARQLNKLRTTFASSIRRYMVNGRIHCTYNQLAREDETTGGIKGARYGRLSSEHPNMQQQPSPERSKFAAQWRTIFEPEEGALYAGPDYSQQEPRLTTHYAGVLQLPGAAEAVRRYNEDPDADNHDMMTRLVHGDDAVEAMLANDPKLYKKTRGQCKNIFLGLCYGEGGAKLANDLGLPTRWVVAHKEYGHELQYFEERWEAQKAAKECGGRFWEGAGEEAQAILDKFNANAPYVRKLAKICENRAKQNGYIKTLLGRRCRFPQRSDGSYDWAHKALNRLIQGGSADQTKKALIEVDRAGHFLQLQVHDELGLSVADVAEGERVAEIMRSVVTLLVPCKVDLEVGPSWGEVAAP